MYGFTGKNVDLEAIRERIAKMNDEALERYGRSAAWLAENDDRETQKVQLAEARAEWRRRHPREEGK
jgi:hypothetical protein